MVIFFIRICFVFRASDFDFKWSKKLSSLPSRGVPSASRSARAERSLNRGLLSPLSVYIRVGLW